MRLMAIGQSVELLHNQDVTLGVPKQERGDGAEQGVLD